MENEMRIEFSSKFKECLLSMREDTMAEVLWVYMSNSF